MNFKAQGSINTMSTMTKAQVRAYEKNNIRRELLTEDVPCDFCGKDFIIFWLRVPKIPLYQVHLFPKKRTLQVIL